MGPNQFLYFGYVGTVAIGLGSVEIQVAFVRWPFFFCISALLLAATKLLAATTEFFDLCVAHLVKF